MWNVNSVCVSLVLFLPFQDKLRLLQEDLESERSLRQRVSGSLVSEFFRDHGNILICFMFYLEF